jgi:hypothetical protein
LDVLGGRFRQEPTVRNKLEKLRTAAHQIVILGFFEFITFETVAATASGFGALVIESSKNRDIRFCPGLAAELLQMNDFQKLLLP